MNWYELIKPRSIALASNHRLKKIKRWRERGGGGQDTILIERSVVRQNETRLGGVLSTIIEKNSPASLWDPSPP
jgi:hypothetical protein